MIRQSRGPRLRALAVFCSAAALAACGSAGDAPTPQSDEPAETEPAAAAPPPAAVTDPRDLNGIWWNENTSVEDLELVGEPPRLTPAGEARFTDTSALKREIDAAAGIVTDVRNCVLAGVPRVWGQPFPMEIAQQPDLTVLMYEHMHSFRLVYMDEPVPDPDEVAMLHRNGNSVGRWEGDTLVIESVAFNDTIFLNEQGLPASEGLRTVERLRKIDDATLEVVTTIEDPEYYVEPWTVRAVLARQPDTQLMEYTCGYGAYETRYVTMP